MLAASCLLCLLALRGKALVALLSTTILARNHLLPQNALSSPGEMDRPFETRMPRRPSSGDVSDRRLNVSRHRRRSDNAFALPGDSAAYPSPTFAEQNSSAPFPISVRCGAKDTVLIIDTLCNNSVFYAICTPSIARMYSFESTLIS